MDLLRTCYLAGSDARIAELLKQSPPRELGKKNVFDPAGRYDHGPGWPNIFRRMPYLVHRHGTEFGGPNQWQQEAIEEAEAVGDLVLAKAMIVISHLCAIDQKTMRTGWFLIVSHGQYGHAVQTNRIQPEEIRKLEGLLQKGFSPHEFPVYKHSRIHSPISANRGEIGSRRAKSGVGGMSESLHAYLGSPCISGLSMHI